VNTHERLGSLLKAIKLSGWVKRLLLRKMRKKIY